MTDDTRLQRCHRANGVLSDEQQEHDQTIEPTLTCTASDKLCHWTHDSRIAGSLPPPSTTSNLSAAVPKSIYSLIRAKRSFHRTDPRKRVETIDVSVHTADDVCSRGMIKLSVKMQHSVGYNSIVAGGRQPRRCVSEYGSTFLARLDDTSLQNLMPKLGPESLSSAPRHARTVLRSGLRARRKRAMISSHGRGHQDLVDAFTLWVRPVRLGNMS